jgi:hypothetical protein
MGMYETEQGPASVTLRERFCGTIVKTLHNPG